MKQSMACGLRALPDLCASHQPWIASFQWLTCSKFQSLRDTLILHALRGASFRETSVILAFLVRIFARSILQGRLALSASAGLYETTPDPSLRSEERRVGEEGRSRW